MFRLSQSQMVSAADMSKFEEYWLIMCAPIVLQDDSTFGQVLFHLHYIGAPDAISMSMSNLSSLYLWFIPVIAPEQMVLQLVLLPYKGHLLFYGGVEVKTISLFGLQNATRDSFVNRIEALQSWFAQY